MSNDDLTVGEEQHVHNACLSECPEKISVIGFDLIKWAEIQGIATLMKRTEFMVFLLGSFNDDGTPEIQGYYIPEQIVDGTNSDLIYENLPEDVRLRIIGHLHSHHGMGAFHSPKDHYYMNWPINIVISGDKYVCTVRRLTSCQKWISSDAKIIFRVRAEQFPGLDRIKTRSRRKIAREAAREMGLMTFDDLPRCEENSFGILDY
jgi:hypothetical protein